MGRISEKTKIAQKRCEGEGENYIPWILANQEYSTGSSFITKNYKSGRDVHLLSNAEAKVFFLLLWDDDVLDIKEQYVLDFETTKFIAEDLGYRKPKKRMSTDFYLKVDDPIYNYMAVSVKSNEDFKKDVRARELQEIEEAYWEHKGIRYELVFADNINSTLVKNIRIVTRINKPTDIQSDVDAIRYLLTNKIISTDMKKDIDFLELLHIYKKEVDLLYDVLTRDEKRYWER